MALTYSSSTLSAMAAAICGLADAGAGAATIQIATSNAFSTILATFTCSDPAFTAGAAGVQDLDVTPALSVAASASGTATDWRLRDSNGILVFSGTVASTANGADITLTTNAVNAAMNAVTAAIGASGNIQLATDSTFSSILATINLNSTPFGAASSGTITMNGLPLTGSATAAGTCTAFRIRANTTEIVRGVVGTSGSDINFDNNVFGIGSTINIPTWSISMGTTSAASVGVMVFAGGTAFTSGEQVQILSGSFTQP